MVKFSKFGQHFQKDTGTRQLMDDLGAVLTSGRPMMNLGGGNPGLVPEVDQHLRERIVELTAADAFSEVVGKYDGPQGHQPFLNALADLLNRQFGWQLSPRNIATTTGSQASFFALFNMLAGPMPDGTHRHVLLPLAPEYIGYSDVGLSPDMVRAVKGEIEIIGQHEFKYHIDFENLMIDEQVAAVCVSRPTNPTGNVITDDELNRLMALTAAHETPLIIDNAYGLPFPNIIFTDAQPAFDDHVILCMSLSKVGLPGMRTGIVIANEEIIHNLTGMNAITLLANGGLGAHVATSLIESGEIVALCDRAIKPFYAAKARQARQWCAESFAGLNYYLHKTEGAIFLWVWFPDLPISDLELYERLKQRDVLVLAGQHFFPGLREPWEHRQQCLRISYAQDANEVRRGIEIIGEEVRRAMS